MSATPLCLYIRWQLFVNLCRSVPEWLKSVRVQPQLFGDRLPPTGRPVQSPHNPKSLSRSWWFRTSWPVGHRSYLKNDSKNKKFSAVCEQPPKLLPDFYSSVTVIKRLHANLWTNESDKWTCSASDFIFFLMTFLFIYFFSWKVFHISFFPQMKHNKLRRFPQHKTTICRDIKLIFL